MLKYFAVSRKSTHSHPTLFDVAREAGVSVSTAARVLRSSSYPVAEKLQRKVRKASEKIGYVPNLLAKKLRGGTHPSIGLIVGNMLDPFFSAIAQSITTTAQTESVLAIVANMQRDPKLEIAMLRELWEHRVNGLILAGGGFDQVTHQDELRHLVDQLRRAGIVVVSLSDRGIGIPVFSVNQEQVGEMLAQFAVHQGHRQIGVSAGPKNSFVTRQRLVGLSRVLKKNNIKATIVHNEFGVAGGVDVVRQLLKENPKITIVLAYADTHAVGIIEGLREQGYSVPEDISVISAGNTSYANLATPQLTSIDTCSHQCCEAAVRFVAASVDGRAIPKIESFIPVIRPGKSVRELPPESSLHSK